MGSNIHLQFAGEAERPDLAPVSDLLCSGNSITLFRLTDGYKFMQAIWRQDDRFIINRCKCPPDDHDYYCDRDQIERPNDFNRLREDTKDLDPWTQKLIAFMEANSNVFLGYG